MTMKDEKEKTLHDNRLARKRAILLRETGYDGTEPNYFEDEYFDD